MRFPPCPTGGADPPRSFAAHYGKRGEGEQGGACAGEAVVAEHKGLPIMDFADQAAWEAWLAAHGAASAGIWLRLAKKSAGAATIARDAAIEGALAYGWIDGQLDRFDADFWLVRFTPRGPRSKWSERNRSTAERLIAERRMAPPSRRYGCGSPRSPPASPPFRRMTRSRSR
jgi:hypothetical protein